MANFLSATAPPCGAERTLGATFATSDVAMLRASTAILLRLALGAMCAPQVAFAQWSTDPANPRVIADHSGEQVQSKMVAIQDGGFYVSWFDSSSESAHGQRTSKASLRGARRDSVVHRGN